ncbi:MAG: hypothetical protein ACK5Z2_05530 [Bacteroidota bacterium]|jgi:hypothetical protein
MIGKRKGSLSFTLVVLLAILFAGSQVRVCNQYPDYIRQSNVISWDALGYYMYLPATIIYNDPGIEDQSWYNQLNETYQQGRPQYQFYPSEKNRLVNVYPSGQAVAMLPFFLGGHIAAKISGAPPDGFSAPYQYAAIFSGLFYSVLGLMIVRRILFRWFSDVQTAFLIALISVGTNQFYYAAFDPTSSHNYLFAGNALLLLFTIKWHEQPSAKLGLLIGVLIGWLTIARPSELVLILIPLLWNIGSIADLRSKMQLLLARRADVLLLIAGMLAVGSIQLIYWKYTSGHFTSYHHAEGFDFLHPFTLKFLFSFKKGWLIYTPLMLLAIAGFIVLWKKQRRLFVPLIAFFIINLWVVSSWECWWYATSWSQRPMIQSYAILVLPLGFLLFEISLKTWLRVATFGFAGFTFCLSIFQMWQYREGIISGDRMTGAYYAAIFGKTEIPPGVENLLEVDRWNALPLDSVLNNYTVTTVMLLDFENSSIPLKHICDTLSAGSGKRSLRLNKTYDYAGNWNAAYHSLTDADHVRIRISADVLLQDSLPETKLVFATSAKGRQQYGYAGSDHTAATLETGNWKHIHADFITPVILHSSDTLTAAVWNAGGTELLIDNVKVEVFVPKKK